MSGYGRDTNIGKANTDQVSVKEMPELIQRVQDNKEVLDEAVSKLNEVSLGIGLVVDEDLEQEANQ